MSEPHKTSVPALLLGWFLSIAGFLLFIALVLGALGFGSGPALVLLDIFSWASFFLPAYLGLAAVIAFMPGFRSDLLFTLTASLVPFCCCALLAGFWNDTEAFYTRWPSVHVLGGGWFSAILAAAALLSALAIAVLRSTLFGSARGEQRGAMQSTQPQPDLRLQTQPQEPAQRYLLPARTQGLEEFRLPDMPPLAQLRSTDGAGAATDSLSAIETAQGAEAVESVDAAEGVDAADGADAAQGAEENLPELEAVLADAERFGLDAQAPMHEDEPIPVMFHRDTVAVTEAKDDAIQLDPAADDGYWESESQESAGNTAVAAKKSGALLPKLEVFQDGEHSQAVRQSAAVDAAEPASARGTVRGTSSGTARGTEHETARVVLPRLSPKRKNQIAYRMPTDGILNLYPDGQYWVIDDKTRRSADILKDTLKEFNIEAEVTGIRKGPVITMFELLPAPGVRLAKIATLSDNIALRLAASSVRIVAPIPGKHAVGIEVPNERRSIVSFREIVENDAFNANKMEIPVILGKDISGEPQIAELTQTPHLLIAGATGAGKSVCVNSIILSILYKRSFNEVKLILIDPKIVELKLYNGIPHLLTPVITESKKAFQALQYCICEMERRYSLLDAMGVRDIKSYNRKIAEKKMATDRLPYIVVIIDEFADLMATTGKELESTLARLAAMSRAVGIHLVLATQRPSIDVITGLIKANIPSRIAFMVASKFDSRIIIDMVGAEKLLGRGDMLYSSATDAFPVRMQGAFVSDEEVERVVAHVKTLGEPDYIDDEIFIDDEEDEGPSLFDEDEDDPLFEKALEIVLAQGKASASFLQRKLKIGYNRAARIVELMEEKGIVGKPQGSKPRDVMRNPDFAMGKAPNPHARYVPDPDPVGSADADGADGDEAEDQTDSDD